MRFKHYFILFFLIASASVSQNDYTYKDVIYDYYVQVRDYQYMYEVDNHDDSVRTMKIKRVTETSEDKTDPKNIVREKLEFVYWPDGKPITRMYPEHEKGKVISYRYDGARNLTYRCFYDPNVFDSMQYENGKIKRILMMRKGYKELDVKAEFVYDEHERVEKVTAPNGSSNMTWYSFKYNDMNLVTEYFHWDYVKPEKKSKSKDGTWIKFRDKFYYDKDYYLSKVEFFRNDSLLHFYDFRYNSDGFVLEYFKKTDYKPKTKGENRIYTHNDEGKLTQIIDMANGEMVGKEIYKYDSLKRLEEKIVYDYNDSLIMQEHFKYKYNKEKLISERMHIDYEFECDKKFGPQKSTFVVNFEYEKGMEKYLKKTMARDECGEKITTVIYYDKKQLITKTEKYRDGVLFYAANREYEYYK